MALDTRSKRASSVGLLLAFVLAPPLPDASLSKGDRQHIAATYSGIEAVGEAALAWRLEFEESSGVWVDHADDLIRDPVRWSRGIFDTGPLGCLARPGVMSFTLDNTEENEAGLAGYWTLGHANAPSWFRRGVRVRLWLSDGTVSRYVWRGRLRNVRSDPGVTGLRTTTCIAGDWLTEWYDQDAGDLELLEGVMADTAMDALVALAAEPPANVDFDPGSDELPFVFDDLGDVPKVEQVAQDLTLSEGGALYLRGDETDGETLRFENRQAGSLSSIAATFTAADFRNEPDVLDVQADYESLANEVEAQTVNRRVDAAATSILISLDQPIEVPAGETVTIFVAYRDPNQEAVFVGGKDMQALVANTDWTANSAEDGSGSNLTSSFTVTATYFGSRAMIECTNNGTTTGFVRGPGGADGLQARGRGLYRYAPQSVKATNEDSVDAVGLRPLSSPLVMPYQPSLEVGRGIAQFKAQVFGDLAPRLRRTNPATDTGEELLQEGIARDLGDQISVDEDQTGLDARRVFIRGLEQELALVGRLYTWWTVIPADTTELFVFDDPISGRFDTGGAFGY